MRKRVYVALLNLGLLVEKRKGSKNPRLFSSKICPTNRSKVRKKYRYLSRCTTYKDLGESRRGGCGGFESEEGLWIAFMMGHPRMGLRWR